MLRKKIVWLAMGLLFGIGSVCWGTPPSSNQQVGQQFQEMRKNLAWLTEGLHDLGQSNDSKLKLTAGQKQKILPFFKALVSDNLVLLTVPPPTQHDNQSGQNRSQYDPNDPKAQARMTKMKDQTEIGNKHTDLIDGVLTKRQLSYIDNLSFDPEKYGFSDSRKIFGSDGRQQQRPGQKTIDNMRAKLRAGQEALVKLNNEVLQMLKS